MTGRRKPGLLRLRRLRPTLTALVDTPESAYLALGDQGGLRKSRIARLGYLTSAAGEAETKGTAPAGLRDQRVDAHIRGASEVRSSSQALGSAYGLP